MHIFGGKIIESSCLTLLLLFCPEDCGMIGTLQLRAEFALTITLFFGELQIKKLLIF